MSLSRKKDDPPRHQWTESQTYRLLELINSSQTYINTFFPPLSQHESSSTKSELEKELCILILEDTDWLKWMIKNCYIEITENGLRFFERWRGIDNPVASRLELIHIDARDVRRKLGNASSEEDLTPNSSESVLWNDYKNQNQFTWYFLYVQAQSVYNPGWINDSQPFSSHTTENTISSSSFSNTPQAGPSSIPYTGGSSTTRNSNSHSTLPTFPQSSLVDRPSSTPIRISNSSQSLPNPSRTKSKRRSLPSQSASTPHSDSTASQVTPQPLENRRAKRRRISPNSSGETPLFNRIGDREPPIISIPSDSEDTIITPRYKANSQEPIIIDSDSDDEDEVVIVGSRILSSSSSASPTPDDSFIPFPKSSKSLGKRPALNQSDNLQAIRNMSGSFMMTPITNTPLQSDSDTDTVVDDESDTSSRPPTPPYPDARPTAEAAGAISPHFIENMFYDPSIRSHRLDALHKTLGIPILSPEKPLPLAPILSERNYNLVPPNEEVEEYDNRDDIVYSPLVITDGTLEDFPLTLDLEAEGEGREDVEPSEFIGLSKDQPIDISDDEDDMVLSLDDSVQTFLNHLDLSIGELQNGDASRENGETNRMDVEPEVSSNTAANDGDNAADQLPHQDDDSWVIVDKPKSTPSASSSVAPMFSESASLQPTIQPTATLSTSTASSGAQLETVSPVTHSPIGGSSSDDPLPPRMPIRQVHTATVNAASPMIRMLLSELRHTKSTALSNIEVAIQMHLLPFRNALIEMIELMGGNIVQVDQDVEEGGKVRYVVCDTESPQGGVEGNQMVSLMELMGVIAELREKELE